MFVGLKLSLGFFFWWGGEFRSCRIYVFKDQFRV